jgi:hypothetical protein
MEAKLAHAATQAVMTSIQRLSREERVNAFLAHCRLMVALYQAGQRPRGTSPRT